MDDDIGEGITDETWCRRDGIQSMGQRSRLRLKVKRDSAPIAMVGRMELLAGMQMEFQAWPWVAM